MAFSLEDIRTKYNADVTRIVEIDSELEAVRGSIQQRLNQAKEATGGYTVSLPPNIDLSFDDLSYKGVVAKLESLLEEVNSEWEEERNAWLKANAGPSTDKRDALKQERDALVDKCLAKLSVARDMLDIDDFSEFIEIPSAKRGRPAGSVNAKTSNVSIMVDGTETDWNMSLLAFRKWSKYADEHRADGLVSGVEGMRKWLREQGVDSPDTSTWEAEFPNGTKVRHEVVSVLAE